MKIIIGLGHPAHYHLFKNMITELSLHNHIIKVVITDKDILEELLKESNINYVKLSLKNGKEGLLSKAKKIIRTTKLLYDIVDNFEPDIMIGSLTQMAYVGKIKKVPFLFFGEDDISYTYLQCFITYPFVKNMVAPIVTKVGIFKYKKIQYSGYQKLAYLHPNVFTPDASLIKEIDVKNPFSVIRLVDLTAYHDLKKQGIGNEVLFQIIERLKRIGKVYISSEKPLPDELLEHSLPINIKYIHHALAFSTIFIGDSQSMTVEAAVLGVPALKFNDFAGKISVLDELEHKYQLSFGFNSKQSKELLEKIDDLMSDKNLKLDFAVKRQKMLSEKIDVTAFFVWLIENYPDSVEIMKNNPEFQNRFR
jgi:uncharacterized protein